MSIFISVKKGGKCGCGSIRPVGVKDGSCSCGLSTKRLFWVIITTGHNGYQISLRGLRHMGLFVITSHMSCEHDPVPSRPSQWYPHFSLPSKRGSEPLEPGWSDCTHHRRPSVKRRRVHPTWGGARPVRVNFEFRSAPLSMNSQNSQFRTPMNLRIYLRIYYI